MKYTISIFLCYVSWGSPACSLQTYLLKTAELNVMKLLNETKSNVYNTYWIEQKLDHFNLTDNRTWKQRYLLRDDLFKTNGPIFLKLAGEEGIIYGLMDGGAWLEYAKETNALMIQLEHRFYGDSRPSADLSTGNLIYLTREQALADVAAFVDYFRKNNDKFSSSKWMTIGGSYSGNLAVWARMKYPNLIHAAWGSSSPIFSKIDFTDFYEDIQKSLAVYNLKCHSNVKEAIRILEILLDTDDGRDTIMRIFILCKGKTQIDLTNNMDKAMFMFQIAGTFGQAAYSEDERYYKKSTDIVKTIPFLCNIMLDNSLGNLLVRLANAHHKVVSLRPEQCLTYNYGSLQTLNSQISWSEDSKDRQWQYQLCTEFGIFPTINKASGVFGNSVPAQFFYNQCNDIFGDRFNLDSLSKAVKKVNTFNEELIKSGKRIIFTHGTLDPWRILGVTSNNTNKNMIVLVINGTHHCADLQSSTSNDPPQLTKVRAKVFSYMKKWLIEN